MGDDSGFAFTFPAVRGRKVSADFDGGRLTSDGGVLLLGQAERRLGIAEKLAACIADPRDQGRVIHGDADILRARMLAIACGYEDADDLDALRHNPGSKLAMGKLPGDPFETATGRPVAMLLRTGKTRPAPRSPSMSAGSCGASAAIGRPPG